MSAPLKTRSSVPHATFLSSALPHTARRNTAAPVIALAASALLLLGGCGQQSRSPGPEASGPSASADNGTSATADPSVQTPQPGSSDGQATAAAPAPAGPATATDETMTQLLQLHAQLKSDLGSAYSDAWIEGNQLHVAVTTPEAEAAVLQAGGVPFRAEFTDAELQEAADALKAWLGTEAAPQVQLHWLSTSGRTSAITVRVPADQVQALNDAVAQQQPTGAVKVIVEESSGPATPLGTNAP